MVSQTDGRRRLLAVCGTGRGVASLSLTSMQPARRHGNERSRAMLRCLRQNADSTYLKHFAFSPEMALIHLNGQYGDAAVIAQIILAGVHLVTRGRGYQLLEHPQIQQVLAHSPTASVTRINTGEVFELFDDGWLSLGKGLPHVRVIVARHSAPPKGEIRHGWQACR